MANKIAFSLQIDGAEQSAQKLKNVSNAVDVLNSKVGKSGQKLSGFISGFPPQVQADILRQLGAGSHVSAPPVITSGGGGINLGRAMLGVGAGMFSPWIGARLLNSSGIFGGGGGGGGIAGSLLGGGAGGFGLGFVALRLTSEALRMSFEQLKDAFVRGSQLFVKAAGLGISTTALAHAQKALTVAGLDPNTAERLIASAQFMRGSKMTPASLQGITQLGVGRGILSREEMQTILNMSEQVSMAWQATSRAAMASASVSAQLQESTQIVQSAFSDLKSDAESVAALIGGATLKLFSNTIGTVEVIKFAWESILDKVVAVAKAFGIVASVPDKNQKFGLGQGSLSGRPESGWEKMGLIIAGGMGGTDYAKQTAHNTKRIADLLMLNKTLNPTAPAGPSVYNHLG